MVSFIGVYSGNNQISNFRPGRVKTALMTEKANYQYNIMPFRLKNVRENYQIMMNKIFREEIRENMKVSMDDMIV